MLRRRECVKGLVWGKTVPLDVLHDVQFGNVHDLDGARVGGVVTEELAEVVRPLVELSTRLRDDRVGSGYVRVVLGRHGQDGVVRRDRAELVLLWLGGVSLVDGVIGLGCAVRFCLRRGPRPRDGAVGDLQFVTKRDTVYVDVRGLVQT